MAGYKSVYDLNRVAVNIGVAADAFPVIGKGSITHEMSEDIHTMWVGEDGSARQSRNNNQTGKVTLHLSADSQTNQLLMLLIKSGVQFPILTVDKTSKGNTAMAMSDGCLLQTMPPFVREKSPGYNDYVFSSTNTQIFHAGAGDE